MQATNSIIIANLPDWQPTSPKSKSGLAKGTQNGTLPSTFLQSLKGVIEAHAEIVHWVPVRSFRRVFCVFINEEEAELVKCALNGCLFEGHRLDVYFGENTPLAIEKKYLEPPVLQRNWLISPPGSPHEGWVQVEEDPPNSTTLHDDIQTALDRLAKELGQHEDASDEEANGKKNGKVILDTSDTVGLQVIVHDWDSDHEMPEFGGKGIRETRTSVPTIGKTPRPPTDED